MDSLFCRSTQRALKTHADGSRLCPTIAQMFLTADALFILVVDMFAYSEDGCSREDALEQWLDILQSRVPGSVVLLVGTHGDSFDNPAECSRRIESFLQGEVERCAWT